MKVVSFVLWGDNPLYTLGAIQNCKDVSTMYPGWESWVYVCGKIPSDILHKLKQVATRVVHVMDLGNCKNTFWRYSPVLDKSVKVFTSRDCDSRITQRECSLVKQWEESKKDLHIIRDHIGHTSPILGGMFSMHQGYLWYSLGTLMKRFIGGEELLDSEIMKYLGNGLYGYDELALERHIYPLSKGKRLSHVSAGSFYPGDIKIPPPDGDNFIGNKMDGERGSPLIQYHAGLLGRR